MTKDKDAISAAVEALDGILECLTKREQLLYADEIKALTDLRAIQETHVFVDRLEYQQLCNLRDAIQGKLNLAAQQIKDKKAAEGKE